MRGRALAWAAAVASTEAAARRARPGRRAAGWALAYAGLGAAALAAGGPPRRCSRPAGRGATAAGVALAVAGYPVGRAILGDRPHGPPPDGVAAEVAVLAGVVAPVEELVWGGLVEPTLGLAPTAALFAAKHVAVDGRWRRALGLGLFWAGLGLVRRRSPAAALAVHVAANAGAVALGHATDGDRF